MRSANRWDCDMRSTYYLCRSEPYDYYKFDSNIVLTKSNYMAFDNNYSESFSELQSGRNGPYFRILLSMHHLFKRASYLGSWNLDIGRHKLLKTSSWSSLFHERSISIMCSSRTKFIVQLMIRMQFVIALYRLKFQLVEMTIFVRILTPL